MCAWFIGAKKICVISFFNFCSSGGYLDLCAQAGVVSVLLTPTPAVALKSFTPECAISQHYSAAQCPESQFISSN